LKNRLTLVAAAVMGLPSIAMSQTSSVTIYGRIDTSINVQKTSATATTASTTRKFVSPDTPWLGFRGSEDLGGGMRAYFKLEHGFSNDTGAQAGQGTQFWNRETYVGLGSAMLGSIQIGSQFTPSLWMTGRLDPYRRSNAGAIMPMFQQAPPLAGWLGYTAQFNNSIQYITPSLGGVQIKLLTAASEGVAALPAGPGSRPISSALEYSMGRTLFAGLSYDKVKITGALVGVPTRPSVSLETIQAGLTYDFNVAKLYTYYIQTEADGGHSMQGGMIGVSIPVGAGEIASSYQKRDAKDALNTDGETIALMYTHNLSKRTAVYIGAAHQMNKGGATFGVWPSKLEAGAAPAGSDVTSGQIGIRHYW